MSSSNGVDHASAYRLRRENGALIADWEESVTHPEMLDHASDPVEEEEDDQVLQGLAPDTGLQYFHKVKANLATDDIALLQMQQLDQQDLTPKDKAFWFKLLMYSQLVVPPLDLRGDQAVTDETRESAKLSATMLTASSLWDYISSIGLFLFIFAGAPGNPRLFLSCFDSSSRFGNHAGRGMVNRLPGGTNSQFFSRDICCAVSLSSLTAGLGVFLFNGGPRLVEAKAAQITRDMVQSRKSKIADLSNPKHPSLINDREECLTLKQQLSDMGTNSPAYQSLQVETFGSWADRRMNPPGWVRRNLPLEAWPVCPRYQKKKLDLSSKLQVQESQLAQLEKKMQSYPSRLKYLQSNHPAIYSENFVQDANGDPQIKNRATAFGAAWNFFFNPPQGASTDLLLSYVYMVVSILTSGSAIAILWSHSRRRETMMSFEPSCGSERFKVHTRHLNKALQELREQPLERGREAGNGISLKQYRNSQNIPRYDLQIRNIWEKGEKDAVRAADVQFVQSSFGMLDLKPDSKGLIVNNAAYNACDRMLSQVLDAYKPNVVTVNIPGSSSESG